MGLLTCKAIATANMLLPLFLLSAILLPAPGHGQLTVLSTALKKNLVMQLDAASGVTRNSAGAVTGWNDLMKKSPALNFTSGCTLSTADVGFVSFDGSSCFAFSPSKTNVHIKWAGEDPKAPFTIAVIYRLDARQTCSSPALLLHTRTHPNRTRSAEMYLKSNSYEYASSLTTTTPWTTEGSGRFTYDCAPTGTWVLDVVTRTHQTGQHNFYRYTASGGPTSFLRRGVSTIVSGDNFFINNPINATDRFKGDVAVVLIYNNLMSPPTVTDLAKAFSPRFGLWTSNAPPPPPPTPLPSDLRTSSLVMHLDAATVEYAENGFATGWPDLMNKCPKLAFREGCVRTIGNIGAVSFDGTGCYAYSPGVLALHYTWYGENYRSPFTIAMLYRLNATHTCSAPARLLRMKTRDSRTEWVSNTAFQTNSYTYSDSNNVTTPVKFDIPCAPTDVWVFEVLTRTFVTGVHTWYRFTSAGAPTNFTRTGPSAIVSGDELLIGPPSDAGLQLKGDVGVLLIYNNILRVDLIRKLAGLYSTRFGIRLN